jgi:hypothetical protein
MLKTSPDWHRYAFVDGTILVVGVTVDHAGVTAG